MTVRIEHGDCLEVLRSLPDASVDSIVTDPPYGLEFMGKDWDAPWKAEGFQDNVEPTATSSGGVEAFSRARIRYHTGQEQMVLFQEWCELWAAECLRVLKPGGHMLAFGGTRTWHRLAVAVEDSGFEIRDSMAWLYGSGFPKSLDVSKAIDKAAGAERKVVGSKIGLAGYSMTDGKGGLYGGGFGADGTGEGECAITAPATPEAEKWQGWGTALKPAFEPIVVARKPLVGTVAQNVLEWGTGAINIDGTRISTNDLIPTTTNNNIRGNSYASDTVYHPSDLGRWPSNVMLDEYTAGLVDEQSGIVKGQIGMKKTKGGHRFIAGDTETVQQFDHGTTDIGGASRFFYVAKAPKRERPTVEGIAHPTVKPLTLMRHLVKLVTPPDGTVLDPFAGSGTTVEAAMLEGFDIIAIEREADYIKLIEARLARLESAQGDLPL